MQKSIVIRKQTYSKTFYAVIAKKRRQLRLLTKRYQELSMDIETIQMEYDLRIGSLFRKSHILDAEIERWRFINNVMSKGLSFEDALKALEKEAEKQKDDEWEFLDIFDDEEKIVDLSHEAIHKLWRKLAQQHHPDFSHNHEDRKKREKLMKLINNAYAAKDLKILKSIEEQELMEENKLHQEDLEKTLVDIENALIRLKKEYDLLKKSEWYSWRKKTREEKKRTI